MVRAFHEMVDTMRKHHVPPRAGAMILAVGRVLEATLVRACFRELWRVFRIQHFSFLTSQESQSESLSCFLQLQNCSCADDSTSVHSQLPVRFSRRDRLFFILRGKKRR